MSEDRPPNSLEEHDSLEDLDARLRAASAKNEPPKPKGKLGEPASGAGLAARIGVEMVSAVIVGALIGVFLDKWLETAPLFLVVFLFLGAAAGVLNVYRTASGYGLAIGYKTPPGKEAKKDEAADDKG